MHKFTSLLTALFLLTACGATTPPPYEKDKTPKDRTYYSGAEGLAQQQKDQQYLMSKELHDKCEQAKLDLLAETSQENKGQIKQYEAEVERSCS